MGQGAAVKRMTTRDLNTRVELVEAGLSSLSKTLLDMREDQKTERKEIADNFAKLSADLGNKVARPFPFKEVTYAITFTVFIIGTVIGVANWWFDARTAVLSDNVASLTRSADPGELAVLKYRLTQLEANTASR